MARPRRNDHNQQLLLDTGLDLLAAQGYHGTGLKQVLDQVGVPKGSFYHYFGSKEQFVAAVISHYSTQVVTQLEKISTASQSPLHAIELMINAGLTQYQKLKCQRGCLVGSLGAELGGSVPACTEAMQQATKSFEDWLTDVIQQAQQQQQINATLPATALSQLFWDCWQGGLIRMQLQGSTAPLLTQLNLLLSEVFGAQVQLQATHLKGIES